MDHLLVIHFLEILEIFLFFSIGVDTVFAGILNDEPIALPDSCSPPISGDWIVNSDCTLVLSKTAPSNVWIQNNSKITIPNQVTLGIDFENFNLTVFSGSGIFIQSGGSIKQQSCSHGWIITGYFTPNELDYSGEFVTIIINDLEREFRQDFVDDVNIEGWGKTLSGDYLGSFDNMFFISSDHLDSNGNVLMIGAVAVDPNKIEPNSNLTIPTLPEPWNEIIFLSSDVGDGINGKHIDVYVGEGLAAEQESFLITSQNNTVCQ